MSAPVIDLRRAGGRFTTTTDWLASRHCFSFGEHYDPDNVGFGRLLVSNDELVRSGQGFDEHPHRDTEIVTWVLSGTLVHEDSSGHPGLVYPGLAQRMSAGRGVVHSERNDAFRIDAGRPAEPAHYVQMWLRPDDSGGEPSYAQHDVDLSGLAGGWLPIASGSQADAAVSLGARGSTLWATVLGTGASRVLPSGPEVHVYVTRGACQLETVGLLAAGDSVRIRGEAALRVTGPAVAPGVKDGVAGRDAELLVWTMDP